MKHIIVSTYGQGVITHKDIELGGLSFVVNPLSGGQVMVTVDGPEMIIDIWVARVNGTSVTETEKTKQLEAIEKAGLESDVVNQEAELIVKKARLNVLKGIK